MQVELCTTRTSGKGIRGDFLGAGLPGLRGDVGREKDQKNERLVRNWGDKMQAAGACHEHTLHGDTAAPGGSPSSWRAGLQSLSTLIGIHLPKSESQNENRKPSPTRLRQA